jgi:hypothetical protein
MVKFDRLQAAIIEDPHVGAPLDSAVEALRTIPVVITWSDKDGDGMKPLEGGLQECRRVWCEPVVLIEVTSTQQGIRFDLYCHFDDLEQRVTQGLPSPPGGAWSARHPCERAVKVKVGKEHYFHAGP